MRSDETGPNNGIAPNNTNKRQLMTFGKWRVLAVTVGLATSFGFGIAIAAEDLNAVLTRTNQYFDKGN